MTAHQFTPFAESVLADMEKDAREWTRIDLTRLLEACGISEVEVIGDGPGNCEMYRHPEFKDIHVLVWPNPDVHSAQVLHVLVVIGKLRQRLSDPGRGATNG